MRITGGRLAGRAVAVPPGVIRPAMDRMRESLFGVLGPLDGLSFLDLFAGSGIMALEALSRGASSAVLVERDRGKRPVIMRNLALAAPPPRLVLGPVEVYVHRCSLRFDVIYLDPPFDYRYKADLIERISNRGLLAQGGRLLIHYPDEEELPDRIGSLESVDERAYGRSRVRFYEAGSGAPIHPERRRA